MICATPGGKVRSVPIPTRMQPREFCREWFSRPGDTEVDRDDREQERGYRQKCIELLSNTTGVSQEGVDKWSKGPKEENLNFSGMPAQYQRTLAYAISLKRVAEAVSSSDPYLFRMIMKRLEGQ